MALQFAVSPSISFFYDPVIYRMLRREFSDGSKDLYIYTDDGRLDNVERWGIPGSGGAAICSHWRKFTYDPRTGQAAKVASPEGTISYTYHKDGSLASTKLRPVTTSPTLTIPGEISEQSAAAAWAALSYSYDGSTGRKIQVSRPSDGTTIVMTCAHPQIHHRCQWHRAGPHPELYPG